MSGFLRSGKRRASTLEVTCLPSGRTITAVTGANLLQAIVAAGEPIAHLCGGEGRCGSCRVLIRSGLRSLARPSTEERRCLRRHGARGALFARLACQVEVGSQNLTVELLNAGGQGAQA